MEFEEFDIEFLSQIMAENPQSPLFARLADLYIGKQQEVESIRISEEGIKFFPKYYAGYVVLGKAHLALKEFSKAIKAFEKALEYSPFNQTVAKLLETVPNKSDESTRTTDESYFLQPSPENQLEPIQTTFEQDQPTITEVQQNPPMNLDGRSISFNDQTISQPFTASDSENIERNNGEPFPTFDEYFAQHQHRIAVVAEKKLDDYLNEDPSEQIVTTSRDIDPAMFTTTTFETTSINPNEYTVPEPDYSSPEQAQLSAEMAGEGIHNDNTPQLKSDIDFLAERLQSAEKIVPKENYQSETTLPDTREDDQSYETEAVTPTLAEIYASQGELRAAIQAYEILMFSQPEKGGEFQKRIRELQRLQMEKDGLI